MGLKSFTINETKKEVTIVMDLETAEESGSGKTMVFASTHGNADAETKYKGEAVKVGVNAYYKNKNYKKSQE